jgi:transcriptional regulator of NAD metabolism
MSHNPGLIYIKALAGVTAKSDIARIVKPLDKKQREALVKSAKGQLLQTLEEIFEEETS